MALTPQERYVLSVLALVKKNSINELTKIYDYFKNETQCPTPIIKDMKQTVTGLKNKQMIDDYHTVTPKGLIQVGNSRLLTTRQILYLFHTYKI